MSIVVVTGSTGLIGSDTVARFCELGHTVAGIDNDMRAIFLQGLCHGQSQPARCAGHQCNSIFKREHSCHDFLQ